LSNNFYPDDLVPVAKIYKPKGLKGELKVFLYNSDSSIIEDSKFVWINNGSIFENIEIESIKEHTKFKIIKFKGVDNRNSASALKNKILFISRIKFPELNNKDEFYLIDLINFNVKDEFGNDCGIVKDIINLPSNDSLIINFNGKEIMIPILDNFIKLFDFKNKLIIIKDCEVFLSKC